MTSFPRWLIAASALAMLVVLCGGVWFYLAREQHLRQEAETDLQTIAQMKADQIVAWRTERLDNAAEHIGCPFTTEAITRWMADPTDEAAEKILTRFRAMQEHHHYHDVILADRKGKARLSIRNSLGSLHEEAMRALFGALQERRPVMTGLHVGPGDLPPHVDVIAPFFGRAEKVAEPVGAMIFQVDARPFLYPLIQFWPTPSNSAETLLVRRDGDTVLFLNELRHQKGTALKLRIPLSRTDVPAVMAVLGKEGFVLGKDYRGIEVLSILKAIPHSPWFMVAKVDAAEALAVWRSLSVLIVALVLAIMASFVTAVGVVWQRNAKAHYQTLYQAEAARRESEQRYRITLISIGDGVIVTDSGGRVDLLNEVAEGLTGWRQEEARGKPLGEVFHIINEETRESVENPVNRVMREGLIVGLANHTMLIARDGTERPIADSGAPIRDENGAITGVVLVFRDQTEERAAQEALRQSEERFRLAFENANIGVCLVDTQGKLLMVNNQMCEMFGYSRSELEGMTVNDIAHPDDLLLSPRFIEGALARDVDRADFEKRYTHKEGHVVWGRVSSTLVRDGLGNPRHFISHVQDITDRKKAEEALRQSEERLSLALDGANLGIWDWDLTTGKALWSERNHRMLGYEPNEFEPNLKSWKKLVHPEDWPSVSGNLNLHMEGKLPIYETEYRALNKAGDWQWLQARGKVIEFDVYGKPIRMAGIIADVTERKRAEEALRQSEEKLKSILRAAPVGIGVVENRVIKEANDHFCEMTGYSREELLNANARLIYATEEDFEFVGREKYKQIAEKGTGTVETRWRRKDGRVIDVLLSSSAIDPADVSLGVTFTALDITERKQKEEALKESEEQYRLLAETARDFIVVHDMQGRIRYVNQAGLDFSGYSPIEASQKVITDFVAIEHLPAAAARRGQRAAGNGQVYLYETEVVNRAGQRIAVEVSSAPIMRKGRVSEILIVARDITDRNRADEAIRQSEARYRSLFDNMLEGFAYCGMFFDDGKPVDFVYLDVNDAFERLTGLRDVVGKKVTEVIPGIRESNPELFEIYGRVALTGNSERFETYIDYLGIWLSISVYSTEREHFIAVFDNITERKRAEDALRESEEQFRSLFENSLDAILLTMPEGSVLRANPAACQMFGLTEEEICRAGREGLTNTSDARLKPALEERERTGKFQGELRLRRKDGTEFPAELSSVLFRDAEGEWKSTMIIRDVASRKRSEEVQKRLATAVEQAAEGILITDNEGTIQYANPAFEKITGYTSKEAVGQNPRFLKSGKHDAAFYRNLWDTIKGGNIWTGRLINRKKDGSFYHEESTISPVKGASGKITNFVAVKRDITDHLELSSQLFQAQKLEAVGTLAGGVAHDFNNLLQVVLGYSELILGDKNLPDQYRKDLARVNLAAKNGADLVRRLLTFSKKTDFKPRPLNLNRQIEQLEKILSRTIPKMINMELILADDLAAINADPTQMEQILMNLALNARDAMPERGRLIIETENVNLDEEYAKTHLGAKPGNYVVLSVSDTGQGIDKETLEHIFEPFFTTKGPGEGTGLGLAMVYGIVQQHSGYIQCYSEVNKGTTFKIYFRALVSDEEVQEPTQRTMPRGGSETILLVDDEELIRDLGSRILRKAGYKVITASNGQEALGAYQARSGEISLVILDLIMPEMGGKQCLEGLLKLNPSVKVLIASGYSANGPTKEALESGAKGFVNKPYDIRQVLKIVRSTLDKEQGESNALE